MNKLCPVICFCPCCTTCFHFIPVAVHFCTSFSRSFGLSNILFPGTPFPLPPYDGPVSILCPRSSRTNAICAWQISRDVKRFFSFLFFCLRQGHNFCCTSKVGTGQVNVPDDVSTVRFVSQIRLKTAWASISVCNKSARNKLFNVSACVYQIT